MQERTWDLKGKGNMIKKGLNVGSVCSGIEAASVAWQPLGFDFKWFSEIAEFPSMVLASRYPNVINIGDMTNIPQKIINGEIETTDIICGGTPCQAYSNAGYKKGLLDSRGNLTLKFLDIISANDHIRERNGLPGTIVFWENVEGVLSDKTNAFGCFISSLAGSPKTIDMKGRFPKAGFINGPKRNVAWRVLDAKYFGIPQQRKRLYVLAGGKTFHPENILFEKHNTDLLPEFPEFPLCFKKDGHSFETFRSYTDCLYSSYATKWNGNAAANNGSLFVVQDDRLRRLTPLECERLMGFPDDYTNISGAKRTNRYQALGNSWAVPVIKWIGDRLITQKQAYNTQSFFYDLKNNTYLDLSEGIIKISDNQYINCTTKPEIAVFSSLKNIVASDVPEAVYISPVGCQGIIRRSKERKLKLNQRLEKILYKTASEMPIAEIEKCSLRQRRGKHSTL